MKKKVVSNWKIWLISWLVLAGLSVCMLLLLEGLSDALKVIYVIIMVVSPIPVFLSMNKFYMRSTLTKDTVTFKVKLTGNNQTFPVGRINRFVVGVGKFEKNKNHAFLMIYANSINGQILGVGNRALKALMKYYPLIPVSLKRCNFMMLRSTAKYLVKNQKVNRHKCVELCKYYHISQKLLPESKNNQNENDTE